MYLSHSVQEVIHNASWQQQQVSVDQQSGLIWRSRENWLNPFCAKLLAKSRVAKHIYGPRSKLKKLIEHPAKPSFTTLRPEANCLSRRDEQE